MKILIGTDILLCYLLKADYIDGINMLIRWLKKINTQNIIDISSIAILTNFAPPSKFNRLHMFVPYMEIPRQSERLKNFTQRIQSLYPTNYEAARTLLAHLNLIETGKCDFLITENPLTHQMAKDLGLDEKVYSIENFIEWCCSEYRALDDTQGVIVSKCKFGELSLKDPFFNTFIKEYRPFYFSWFERKAKDDVFVCKTHDGKLKALLKLKVEEISEDYSDILPVFRPARRLKVCSFKVDYNGQKLGERFMRIIFQSAKKEHVEEIYITVYNNNKTRRRLVDLVEKWGFELHGYKNKNEEVYVKKMNKIVKDSLRKSYPYHIFPHHVYIVNLNETYTHMLLPEDDLYNNDYDVIPSKHSLRKVLVLNKVEIKPQNGDALLFYSKEKQIHCLGLVETSYCDFPSCISFIERCKKRSTLSSDELIAIWNKMGGNLTVIDFIYNKYLRDKVSLSQDEMGKLSSLPFQSYLEISHERYKQLMENVDYEECVDFYKA